MSGGRGFLLSPDKMTHPLVRSWLASEGSSAVSKDGRKGAMYNHGLTSSVPEEGHDSLNLPQSNGVKLYPKICHPVWKRAAMPG